MNPRATFAEEAPRYWDANFRVVPMQNGAKHPPHDLKGWPGYVTAVPTQKLQVELLHRFGEHGIGLLLGAEVAPSLKIAAVDVGVEELVPFVRQFLGNPVCAKRGRTGVTFFVTVGVEEPLRTATLRNFAGSPVLDLLFNGRVTTIPPSIHPATGRPYEWEGRALLDCSVDELPQLTSKGFELLRVVLTSPDGRAWIDAAKASQP